MEYHKSRHEMPGTECWGNTHTIENGGMVLVTMVKNMVWTICTIAPMDSLPKTKDLGKGNMGVMEEATITGEKQ